MTDIVSESRRDFGRLFQRREGGTWYLRYRANGRERTESLGTTSRRKADQLAAVIGDRVGRGEHTPADARRLSFADLESILRVDYRNKGNRSLPRAERALTHLCDAFGASKALALTKQRIDEYATNRLDAGASRATVNYELAVLRRMLTLAVQANRLPTRPTISTPDPRNAREGFFEADDFAAVVNELVEYLRAPMRFAYYTGWRVPSEVLALTWARVDFGAGVVRCESGDTKNDAGKTFPFSVLPELAALLGVQHELKKTLERETGQIIPWVFHRNGLPIKNYYVAWRSACNRAAKRSKDGTLLSDVVRPQLIGRIPHDFRRTACRNLVRAGVSEHTAMKLTGHKTRAIFDRYDIVNEADLRVAVKRLGSHLSGASQESEQTSKGITGGQTALKVVGDS